MRFALTMVTAITCSTLALPVVAEVTLGIALGTADSVETINYDCDALDLSRFRAAPGARLGHLAFESDRAFPTQC